ncbi:MAG: redox-sensitive bicupin YhaK (pirin superfamily) [Myxococcota bacterium]|jgi:redox-sensitive bicupin YhaK (pirin superfamily)
MSERAIIYRTRGHGHGPITRLVSPHNLGEQLKPFVFLDLFRSEQTFVATMPIHPHSGIATVTVLTQGDMTFVGPAEGAGTLAYGGVEWMRASGGVWHGDEMARGTQPHIVGFQLWVALPPETESAEVDRQYLDASHTPTVGPARLILGSYQAATSPVRAPAGMNYLLVTLADGASWTYEPPPGHRVGWLAVSHGMLETGEPVQAGELAVFTDDGAPIHVVARGETRFVIASAVPHPHPLITGDYSVHTSSDALIHGERRIAELRPNALSTAAGRRVAEIG